MEYFFHLSQLFKKLDFHIDLYKISRDFQKSILNANLKSVPNANQYLKHCQ